jgi:ubiquinone/menaquinone biosynthesis C-methylase UbiE
MSSETKHADAVHDRFTATVDGFYAYAVAKRGAEADHLAEVVTSGLLDAPALLAVDVACGPGTLTFPLAARVGRVIGVDVTPAMIESARAEAARKGLKNIEFILGDATSLPLADRFADIVTCGYSIHHILELSRALKEMARILRPHGRMAILDLVLVASPDPAVNNAIERVRDPSHATKQSVEQFHALYAEIGLHVVAEEISEHRYDFDEWMLNAGRSPGDPSYTETRRMMETTICDDAAGFHPSYSTKTGALEFVNTSLLLVGEKTP